MPPKLAPYPTLVGTAITGTRTSPPIDAGQRAFHSRDDDQHAGALQSFLFAKESMKPGDTDIVEAIDVITHELSRDDGLLGDGKIGCAPAHATRTMPWPRTISSLSQRDRASLHHGTTALGTTSRTASNASSVVRVTSSGCPADTIRSESTRSVRASSLNPARLQGTPAASGDGDQRVRSRGHQMAPHEVLKDSSGSRAGPIALSRPRRAGAGVRIRSWFT